MEGHARTKVVIYQFLTTDAGVRSYTRPCGVYGVRSDSGPFFFPLAYFRFRLSSSYSILMFMYRPSVL